MTHDDPTLTERAAQVLVAIKDFETCLSHTNLEVFANEKIRRAAVERAFEIICGTLSGLPDSVKARQPQIDWRGMAELENRLREFYYCKNDDALSKIANQNMPLLKAFVERVISESEQ